MAWMHSLYNVIHFTSPLPPLHLTWPLHRLGGCEVLNKAKPEQLRSLSASGRTGLGEGAARADCSDARYGGYAPPSLSI